MLSNDLSCFMIDLTDAQLKMKEYDCSYIFLIEIDIFFFTNIANKQSYCVFGRYNLIKTACI